MGCIGQTGVYGSQDAEYLKSLYAQQIAQSNVVCEYYSLNRGVNVDALYGEPDNDPLYGGSSDLGTPQTHNLSWDFCPDVAGGAGPLIIPCTIEYVESEQRNPMVRPEGKIVEYDAMMMIADVHWECNVGESEAICIQGRVPKEGDVVFGFEEWWDVVKVGRGGNILGTPVTVGRKFELKKRSQFTPDRKVRS